VGDTSGFLAAIFKRGIPYIQIPTTLLAQVDAAIGGKTGVDVKEAKNLLGSFYHPRLVLIDPLLLKTLNKAQMLSAIAEVIKYAAIKDKHLFKYLEDNFAKILQKDLPSLEFVILRCAKIKARIVSQDEREKKGIRTLLNFGHTIGHALEAASGYAGYSHGEAVALGMLVAADLSHKYRLISQEKVFRLAQLIKNYGLPTLIKGITLEKIIQAMPYDKKFQGEKTRFVLLKDIGCACLKNNVPYSLIKEALAKRISKK